MVGQLLQGRRVDPTRFARAASTLALALGVCLGIAGGAQARESTEAGPAVALKALPVQAQQTHALVLSGGPFPYAKDGTVFGNREGVLPSRPRGYYTEYTVPTPGSRDRGARRIVAGGDPEKSGEYYYTSDHYRSFQRIRE